MIVAFNSVVIKWIIWIYNDRTLNFHLILTEKSTVNLLIYHYRVSLNGFWWHFKDFKNHLSLTDIEQWSNRETIQIDTIITIIGLI